MSVCPVLSCRDGTCGMYRSGCRRVGRTVSVAGYLAWVGTSWRLSPSAPKAYAIFAVGSQGICYLPLRLPRHMRSSPLGPQRAMLQQRQITPTGHARSSRACHLTAPAFSSPTRYQFLPTSPRGRVGRKSIWSRHTSFWRSFPLSGHFHPRLMQEWGAGRYWLVMPSRR